MNDMDTQMDLYRKQVEIALEAALPPVTLPPASLHEAMRYAVLNGGKRIRPILCLASAKAVGSDPEHALSAAVALELLHTFTLVHDDIPCMDDDDFRRGVPTVHKKFTEAIAVLTGDALQSLAFEVLTKADPPLPFTAAHMLAILASAAGSRGVAGGQVEDISPPSPLDPTTLRFVHYHKTAVLFRAATRLGAMAGGADDNQLSALTDFGTEIGFTFQIVDDLLDAPSGDAPTTAKPDGVTCLSLYSQDQARQMAKDHVRRALEKLAQAHDLRSEFLVSLTQHLETRIT